MGNAISIHHEAIDDMLKALGLGTISKLTAIELRADCNGPVSLVIHRLLEDEEAKEITEIFEKYELRAKAVAVGKTKKQEDK